MRSLIVSLYQAIPDRIKQYIFRYKGLKRGGKYLLRIFGVYRETCVKIKRAYGKQHLDFKFYASFNVASKAKDQGIENTLLHRSLQLSEQLKPKNKSLIVLDIGANFGFLSLVWGQTVAKQGRVYAFEPNPHVASSFHKSVRMNAMEDTISIHQHAVGKAMGPVNLFLDNTTSNTINRVPTMRSETVSQIEVNMVTIDAFISEQRISACDVIKIDVDGIELDILEGSTNTLNRFRPLYIVETNNDCRILDFFKSHNYTLLDMNLEEYQSGNALPPNVFGIPN
ncbi:FkbM family methyltransferase [Aestuariivivens sediminis]|uniref:FkbM family methyltransferase n=1 Tax=Aestuariivivens sediminis TaxID=2913557 RepID=UPI001F569FE7|nr:FkbM family methyltransferase [Aestuariivivens sediminis]